MSSEKQPEPQTLELENKIIELRRAGATWQRIAEQTGFAGPSGAFQAYQRAAKRFVRPNLEELRDIELDRLDRLQMGVWAKALNGDIRALDSVLRIIDRRARLLGLDAPKELNVKAEVSTYDPNTIDAEVLRLIQLLDSSAPRELDAPASETGASTD
jgi:hypothetical protein